MSRKVIYGTKKNFIACHYEDIRQLRKRMSAKQISEFYGGIISLWDIYKIEKDFQKK
jgi:hypothetical protein